ncbi:MAG: RecX family transcriptional regulator [Clostridia bacterium]|nr:RecX family transcriptional regulator [Clostridia bacterium]
MVKITELSIQEKNKNKCNLFVDGQFKSGILLETAMKYRLKADMEIDEQELNEILFESQKSEALSRAVAYISRRQKSKREVKDYLLSKGYEEKVVWYAVDKLKEYGYIDDKEYSRRYIESVSRGQGKRLTEYKLMMKGVRKEDIEGAYEESNVDEKQNAIAVAKKHIRNKEINRENLAKTYRYLIGKGFSHENAGAAIDELKSED